MKWTQKEVDFLRSKLERGWKVADISNHFHISDNAVAKKAQSLGISTRGGVPLKKKPGEKASGMTWAGRRARGMADSAPAPTPNPSTDVPAPTDPSATEPAGEFKREDGGASWRPTR